MGILRCKYGNVQVCQGVNVQMCKCEEYKCANVQVCKRENVQICICASVQMCKYASQPMQSLNVSRFFSVSTRLMAIGLVFGNINSETLVLMESALQKDQRSQSNRIE